MGVLQAGLNKVCGLLYSGSVKTVCALVFTTNRFRSLSSKAKNQLLWLESIGSDHWLSSENAKTFPFLPAFYRKKIVFYFYLVSAGLNSQLYWKRNFFSFKDLWATTNLLAKPGRGGRGWGWCWSSPGAPWDTNSGQSTPAWEWLKAHPSPFCLVTWAPTVLFNGAVRNLLLRSVGMFMDKTNNLFYNIKWEFLEGAETRHYPSVENVCTGMLSIATGASFAYRLN